MYSAPSLLLSFSPSLLLSFFLRYVGGHGGLGSGVTGGAPAGQRRAQDADSCVGDERPGGGAKVNRLYFILVGGKEGCHMMLSVVVVYAVLLSLALTLFSPSLLSRLALSLSLSLSRLSSLPLSRLSSPST